MELFGGNISDNSKKLYLSNIKRLNGNVIPKNTNFLKDTDKINSIIDKYSNNTKKSYYISIVSYLKDKKVPKKTKDYWIDKMNSSNKEFKERSDEKTEKQKDNWIEWDEVLDIHKKMGETLPKKASTEKEYLKCLSYLVLSLYVLISPRRVRDYAEMLVVPEYKETMSKENNYLDVKNKKFVFNTYKTKGAYGQQVEDIPKDLFDILKKMSIPKEKTFEPIEMVLTYKGEKPAGNYITRLLNNVFGKNVSASMLRNIYVSHKLGKTKTETKELAKEMATSTNVLQNVYNKE
jgi:hypothetical protein